MDNDTPIKFVKAGAMADLLGVKARQVRRWAHEGKIPKLILPGGRFVFNPKTVIEALDRLAKEKAGETDVR
jgi:excisionase family DNA binding protein